MRIKIEYEASWRNSFLDGSNSEAVPKNGRGFIASMSSLKQEGNYINRKVSKNTVMGILNRLIGDQRKLYQARACPNYYFSDIEKILQDSDIIDESTISNEMVFIRNVTGSTDQNSFTGLIKANDPAFKSDFASALWGVLWLNLNEVCEFITNKSTKVNYTSSVDPVKVCDKLEELSAGKSLNIENTVEVAFSIIKEKFPDVNYLTAKGQLPLVSLYTSAIYIQVERLKLKYNLSETLTKSGGLSGISKRGFTKKDFMSRYTTGSQKLIYGNPYLLKQRIKGIGEVTSMLNKANGILEINLNISEERALELEERILDAGVSSFYIGKKGLAYVIDINTGNYS